MTRADVCSILISFPMGALLSGYFLAMEEMVGIGSNSLLNTDLQDDLHIAENQSSKVTWLGMVRGPTSIVSLSRGLMDRKCCNHCRNGVF